MKNVFGFLIMILVSHSVIAEDMQTYLLETKKIAEAGEYDRALERYIWFHHHALEHQPAMAGVRLSYALSYWDDLAQKHPPAKQAMIDVRDQKTERMATEKADVSTFIDITALNQTLKQNDASLKLFDHLDKSKPVLAKDCWIIIQDHAIDQQRYDLAKKYVGNLMREFKKKKELFEHQQSLLKEIPFGRETISAHQEDAFVKNCMRLIKLALALEDLETAKELQLKSLEVVDDFRLRDAVDGTSKPK